LESSTPHVRHSRSAGLAPSNLSYIRGETAAVVRHACEARGMSP
jgi:hypothetical protein